MAQDHFGLFDTAPDRRELRLALTVAALVLIAFLACWPVYDIRLGEIDGFVPTITAAMVLCDLITATILYAQAAVFRSRALKLLASGYLFGGCLLIPWALTFPGAFSESGLLGAGVSTTGWIAIFWRLSAPVAVILYALHKRWDDARGPVAERHPRHIFLAVLVSVGLAIAVTLLATLGHDLLPTFFVDRGEVVRSTLIAQDLVVIASTLAAIALLFRQKMSVLDMWLLVAMWGWLAQSLLNVFLTSRFTLGAYAFIGLVFASNLIVMLALVVESNRLYARLALAMAERTRERGNRLMAIDAVATAIAHEVGQPLAATKLSISAALASLTAPTADADRAVGSLNEALDANVRTFAVIKSIRETFGKAKGERSEFSLNDLVRETAALLDRELAVKKIPLQLALYEALPTVIAHRVQIQRVLFNLLTNAIEALAERPMRARRIAIRTAATDSEHVTLEVSDSGAGIAPDEIDRIFEPFFTTKSGGTGLGLSLCSTIVEEHGGRLWASANADTGTTFHLLMNCGHGKID